MLKSLNICRICSSRGDYDIFNVIPAYLHENINEFLYWKKDISKLIEETTGLVVNPDDDLPRKICAICISYLKHASTFRQQAISSALSLKASQQKKIKIPLEECDLEFSQNRVNEIQNLFNAHDQNQNNTNQNNITANNYIKKLTNIPNNTKNQLKLNVPDDENNLNACLNLLFDKDVNKKRESINRRRQLITKQFFEEQLTATTSDEYDDNYFDDETDYFNYKEKNFVEDDVLHDILNVSNITINVPEYYKERKCRACFKRFMFDESYNEHKEKFCVEYKLLMLIEEANRLLTIRRRKAISPHEFIRRMIFCLRKIIESLNATCNDEVLPKLLEKNNSEVDKKVEKNIPDSLKIVKLKKNIQKEKKTNNLLKSNFKIKPELNHLNYSSNHSLNSPGPEHLIENIANSFPSPPIINFSERCVECGIQFDTIELLEEHNTVNHSNKNDKHKEIIALFEDDDQ